MKKNYRNGPGAEGEEPLEDGIEPNEVELPEDLDPELVEAAIRAGEAAANDDLKKDAGKLKEERDRLLAELAETQDEALSAKAAADEAEARYQRLQADWDNFRKRTAQERVTERERAAEGVIEALLPAVDDLERAIEHAEAAESEAAQGLAQGVSAVRTKILTVFEKHGVSVIDPLGEPFDPLESQAVGTLEDPEVYADTVTAVLRLGYAMGGKVIRPAMVQVSVGGPTRPAEGE